MREEVYRTILEQMDDGVYFVDLDRRITFWNAGAERLTGYGADEVLNHPCSEGILRHVSESGTQLCVNGCPLQAVMQDGKSRETRVYLHHKKGYRVPVVVKGSPIFNDNGEIVGCAEVFSRRRATRFAELTDRERKDDAFIDPLTDLGNRRYGESQLDSLLATSRAQGSTLGIVFIDVDHFKNVNDTYGHRTGDAVLRMVGQNLAHGLRGTDVPIRWGGEEFVAILPGVTPEALRFVAERLRMLVEHSWLEVKGEQLRVTISAGAVMVADDETIEQALDRADRLMYDGKHAGRNLVIAEDGPVKRRADGATLLRVSPPPGAQTDLRGA